MAADSERAFKLGFCPQVCRAENHPIQYLQTPLKRVKPNTCRHSCLLKQTPLAFFTLGYMTHKAKDVLILNYAYYTCEFLSVIQIE